MTMYGAEQHLLFAACIYSRGGLTLNTSTNVKVAVNAEQYLCQRLDNARDLYLLALALGKRDGNSTVFDSLIREARIHFAAGLEEERSQPGSGTLHGQLQSQHVLVSGRRCFQVLNTANRSGLPRKREELHDTRQENYPRR